MDCKWTDFIDLGVGRYHAVSLLWREWEGREYKVSVPEPSKGILVEK